MVYRDARDTEFGTGHGVLDTRPDRTLCGLDATLLIVRDQDWELGTHRTKCADCIVLAPIIHPTVSFALPTPGTARPDGERRRSP